MKYLVRIGEEELEIDFDRGVATVDGREIQVSVSDIPHSPLKQVEIGHRVLRIAARKDGGRGRWILDTGSGPVEAEALTERARAIREMAGASEAEGAMTLEAPMPGLVVRVDVAVGDEVQEGQSLVVVEAMKMENELKSPASGRVASVDAEVGKPVEKGATLVVLE